MTMATADDFIRIFGKDTPKKIVSFATVFDEPDADGKVRLKFAADSFASETRHLCHVSYRAQVGDYVMIVNGVVMGPSGAYRGGEGGGGDVDAPIMAQFNAHLNDGAAHGIGNKSELLTQDKTSIVKAMNELFTIANDIKVPVSAAITAKGVPASPQDTGVVLASKIMQIEAGGSGVYYADGTVTSTSHTPQFQFARTTGTSNSAYITVEGLGFLPDVILITEVVNSNATSLFYIQSSNDAKIVEVIGDASGNIAFNGGAKYKADVLPAYVSESGFLLPVIRTSVTYFWRAFG